MFRNVLVYSRLCCPFFRFTLSNSNTLNRVFDYLSMRLVASFMAVSFCFQACGNNFKTGTDGAVGALRSITLMLFRSQYNSYYYDRNLPTSINELESRWLQQAEGLSDLDLIEAVASSYEIILEEVDYWSTISGPSLAVKEYEVYSSLDDAQKRDVAKGKALVFLSLIRGRFHI